MGKVKIKRKSTLIDMTAMSDVTVLLLTFFMLTSTFLQKEPVIVETPSSVQEQKVPTSNVVNVLVSPHGEVFLAIAGEADPDASASYYKEQDPSLTAKDLQKKKGIWASDSIRIAAIKRAIAEYNATIDAGQRSLGPKVTDLTEDEIARYAKSGNINIPIADIKKFVSLSQSDQDKVFTEFFKLSDEEKEQYNKNPNNIRVGIPINIDPEHKKTNEFQIWMKAIRQVSQNDYPMLYDAMKKGEGIAVKADKSTDYSKMHTVMDNLQTINMTRFTLMTALKSQDQ